MSLSGVLDRVRGRIRSLTLLLQYRTWRVKVEGRDEFNRMVENGDRFILCFWHGKYVPILPILRGTNGCVITSATRNGNIIAQIVSDFGFSCTQIPDGGGHSSLRRMEAALSEVRMAGIAVDGPLGPYHQVKQGVIKLASRLGYHLLPVSVDAHRKCVVKKRWDLLEVPFPFARVCLVMGDPIEVPSSLGPEGIGACSIKLRHALDLMDARAADLVGENRGAKRTFRG